MFTPVAAATQNTYSIDPVTNRLIIRYQMADGKHIAVYDLVAATAGNSAPLANFNSPNSIAFHLHSKATRRMESTYTC